MQKPEMVGTYEQDEPGVDASVQNAPRRAKGRPMTRLVIRAMAFAAIHHKSQLYSGEPYLYHLDMVAKVLHEFGAGPADDNLIAAAYLHDVVEDTDARLSDIEREFGNEIRRLVYCVTNEGGKNRAERHEKTYPKIRSDASAVRLKLADRIANCRASLDPDMKESARLIGMYRKEYAGFRAALWREGEFPEMWAELDRLCDFVPQRTPEQEREWVRKMSEAEDGCDVSVGGLLVDMGWKNEEKLP